MTINTDLKTLYDQLCTSYHAVDDFRAKLLALLPFVSGVAIFQILGKPEVHSFLHMIGIFGTATGIGLFIYEMKGIQKCTRFIHFGSQIEKALISDGKFTGHFNCVTLDNQKKWTKAITEPVASAIIYAAVISAWVYVATIEGVYNKVEMIYEYETNLVWPIVAVVVVFGGGILFWQYCMSSLEEKSLGAK